MKFLRRGTEDEPRIRDRMIEIMLDWVPTSLILLFKVATALLVIGFVMRFIGNQLIQNRFPATSQMNSISPLKNLAVVGCTGAGKSTLCNSFLGLLGEDTFFEIGQTLESCTNKAIAKEGILFGDETTNTKVRVSDTGGLGDTEYRDYAFVDQLAYHIRSIGGVLGVIYVHNACNTRFDAQSRSALESLTATLTDDTNIDELRKRVAIVLTQCTEDPARRALYNNLLPNIWCRDIKMCSVPLFWYSDYEREQDNLNCKRPSLAWRRTWACLRKKTVRSFDMTVSQSESWRAGFAKWVQDLPAYPTNMPSKSMREKLKVKHEEAITKRANAIRLIKEQLAGLEEVAKKNDRLLHKATELRKELARLQDPAGCFAASSKVLDRYAGFILMKDLQIGISEVATSDGWSPVTTFLHWHPNETVKALVISLEYGSLMVTPDHLLFAKVKRGEVEAVPAKKVNVGAKLWFHTSHDGRLAKSFVSVSDVRTTFMDGYYAPLTASGTIFVDNIAASCYTHFEHFDVSHKVANAFLAPLRFVSQWFSYEPSAGDIHPYARFLVWLTGY